MGSDHPPQYVNSYPLFPHLCLANNGSRVSSGGVWWLGEYKCLPMLIQLGKNKATITIFEPNLKQTLLNTGKDHRY